MIFSLPALPTNYSLLSAVALALLTIAGMQVFKDEIAMEGNLWRLALGGFVGSWFFVFILTVCQWNHVHCTDPLGGNSVYVTDSITTCNSVKFSPFSFLGHRQYSCILPVATITSQYTPSHCCLITGASCSISVSTVEPVYSGHCNQPASQGPRQYSGTCL